MRPATRNDRFGVQRMEMLAIYFALADNRSGISSALKVRSRSHQKLTVSVRSDSKTSVEQLQGVSEVRDAMIERICNAIRWISITSQQTITFNHLDRRKNIAGLLLEQRRRKLEEEMMMLQYQTDYYTNHLGVFLTGPNSGISA